MIYSWCGVGLISLVSFQCFYPHYCCRWLINDPKYSGGSFFSHDRNEFRETGLTKKRQFFSDVVITIWIAADECCCHCPKPIKLGARESHHAIASTNTFFISCPFLWRRSGQLRNPRNWYADNSRYSMSYNRVAGFLPHPLRLCSLCSHVAISIQSIQWQNFLYTSPLTACTYPMNTMLL